MISSSDALVGRCCYSQAGVYCLDGFLHRYRRADNGVIAIDEFDGVISEPELLEGSPFDAPCAKAKVIS